MRPARSTVALLIVGASLVGCDDPPAAEDTAAKGTTGAQKRRPPAFDWRTALQTAPDDLEDRFGPRSDDCAGDAPLDISGLRRPDRLYGETRGCRIPEPDTSARRYHVTRILYADERPLLVALVPESNVELSHRTLERLDLPVLEARRQIAAEIEGERHRILQFRRRRVAEAGRPLGVDLIATGGGTAVDRALIYVSTGDGAGRRLAEWVGPPASSRKIAAPASLYSVAPHADLAVEIGVDAVRLRRWDDYPVRESAESITPSPIRFPRSAIHGGDAGRGWADDIESFIEEWGRTLRGGAPPETGPDAGAPEPPRAVFGIAANRTAPIDELAALVRTLDALSRARFQLVVRQSRRWAPEFSRYVERGVVPLDLQERGPEERSRTGRRFLNLLVRATADGFELVAGGRTLPPVEGCPDPGPTICAADPEVDLRATLRRAERLQAAGRLEKSSAAVDEALSRFDWATLQENLRRIREQYADASRVFVAADPGLPVAVLVRTMDLARLRLRAPDWKDCDRSFDGNASLADAVPCRDSSGRRRSLYDRVLWRIE